MSKTKKNPKTYRDAPLEVYDYLGWLEEHYPDITDAMSLIRTLMETKRRIRLGQEAVEKHCRPQMDDDDTDIDASYSAAAFARRLERAAKRKGKRKQITTEGTE